MKIPAFAGGYAKAIAMQGGGILMGRVGEGSYVGPPIERYA